MELIIVDDGSHDRCPQMCDEWAQKDSRIKVIHKQNQGMEYARNTGIDISIGKYLMYVDSDDYLLCDAVEILYTRMKQGSIDLAIGKIAKCYNDGSQNALSYEWMDDTVICAADAFEFIGSTSRSIHCYAWGKCTENPFSTL